jgi:hypothetical protein
MLAVSGRLDPALCGPSVPPYLSPYMDGRGKPKDSGPLEGEGRRSIYLAVRRNFMNPMFLAFDYPIPASPMGLRGCSTVPAQALILMNNSFVIEQSKFWGEKIAASAETDDKKKIELMYTSAFARPPEPEEINAALEFIHSRELTSGREETSAEERAAWTDLAHALFNVTEFIYVN